MFGRRYARSVYIEVQAASGADIRVSPGVRIVQRNCRRRQIAEDTTVVSGRTSIKLAIQPPLAQASHGSDSTW